MKMKRVNFGIIVLLLAMVTTTCTKEKSDLSFNDDPILKAAKVENVVVINPSGGDDTQNILDAFEAAKAEGPGSTVYLSAGTFYVSKPVAVADFNGTFKGAGKDRTMIQVLDGITFPLHADDTPKNIGGGFWSDMFVFYMDEEEDPLNMTVCNLSFYFNRPTVVYTPPFYPGSYQCVQSIVTFTGKTNAIYDESEVNVHLYNLGFEGENSTEYVNGYSVESAIYVIGEGILDADDNFLDDDVTLSKVLIEDCDFHSLNTGMALSEQSGSKVLIRDNYFSDMLMNSIFCWEIDNSQYEITKNTLDCAYGADIVFYNDIWNVPQEEPSEILIHHNMINASEVADGIIISDFCYWINDNKSLDVNIMSNKFNLNTSWGGIFTWASTDLFIGSNSFSGTAGYGVDAGYGVTDRMLMRGNNFNHLTALYAAVLLEEGSSNCTVIGGDNATNVLDLGTNNILTGVTAGASPGISNHEAAINKIKKMHPRFNPLQ